ncbi:plasmid pRiA4b ORF-3 family protein [Flexivirga lutea]
MANKEPVDPQMQALVDQALASGDPIGFITELTRQLGGAATDPLFESNPEIDLPDPPLHPALITVRVDLLGAHPPIWRRLELRGDLTLTGVHDHLQAAFGWSESHLHRFDAPGAVSGSHPYFVTEFDLDEGDTGTNEADARLDQVLRKPGERLRYTYDFGDNWKHEFKVESVRPATDEDPPARCTGGRGACPPEDVGGIHTWNDLAAALRADPDPTHLTGALGQYADWLPPGCDPDEFSVAEANNAISFVGADAEELLRGFEAPDAGGLPSELPEPRTELASLLNHCPDDIVDILAGVAGRALTVAADDTVTDADIREALRPWQAMLDAVSDEGVQLTSAGWLPPATVQRVWQESGFTRSYGGKANREQNTTQVRLVREESVRAGLLRKNKGRLLLTKKGRQCRDSQDELLDAVAGSLLHDKYEFVQDARVISVLFIAADWQIGPDSRWAAYAAERGEPLRPSEIRDAFWDDVAHLMNEIGWRLDASVPLHRGDMGYETHHALRMLDLNGSPLTLPNSPAIRTIARAALFT